MKSAHLVIIHKIKEYKVASNKMYTRTCTHGWVLQLDFLPSWNVKQKNGVVLSFTILQKVVFLKNKNVLEIKCFEVWGFCVSRRKMCHVTAKYDSVFIKYFLFSIIYFLFYTFFIFFVFSANEMSPCVFLQGPIWADIWRLKKAYWTQIRPKS